jgi:hypothetical protein
MNMSWPIEVFVIVPELLCWWQNIGDRWLREKIYWWESIELWLLPIDVVISWRLLICIRLRAIGY